MAFSDPQSVTINAVAQSLPEISRSGLSTTYRKSGGAYTLRVSHVEAKRNRRTVRLDFEKVAADPFDASVNQKFTGSVYVVIDSPPTGFSDEELKNNVLGLTGWLTSANILKVLGGES
jgi:hypothetical protein